jgi:hypothetical protein
MKKLLFSLLAAASVLAATFAVATSCNKVENPKELLELGVLIAEAELLDRSHYTAESWAPLASALTEAKHVAGSKAPTVAALNTAIKNLRSALDGLVRVAGNTASAIVPACPATTFGLLATA